MNFRPSFRIVVLLAGTPLAALADAEIYKHIDEDGNVVYSDEPPASADSEVIELPNYDPPSTPTPVGRVGRRTLADKDLPSGPEVQEEQLINELEAYHERRCNEARVALNVLHQGMPVYRVGDGQYRALWSGDTYEGPRTYLSDAQRDEAINAEFRKLVQNCEDPLDMEKQSQASSGWINEEECRAAQVNLQDLLKPGSRAPDQAIEERQKLVDRYCAD